MTSISSQNAFCFQWQIFSCFSEMSGIASVSVASALLAVVLISGSVLSSDVNWGKKVSCFVVEQTVVCPGCNYRAGE